MQGGGLRGLARRAGQMGRAVRLAGADTHTHTHTHRSGCLAADVHGTRHENRRDKRLI